MSVIDTLTNTITTTVTGLGVNPAGVAISPDGTRVYVANFTSNTVSVIDIAISATASVGVGANPAGVAIADIAEPPGPPPPGPRPAPAGLAELPITGSRSQTYVTIALTMIGLGTALLMISHRLARRRRETT